MDNQENQPTPEPAPKKSNTAVIVIIIVVVVVLPIISIAIIVAAVTGFFAAHPEIAQQIEDEIERTVSDNYVAGTWNCANGTGSKNDRDHFTTTLELNEDMTFRYGQYGDLSNNHYSGTYTFTDEDKKNASGDYSYYMIDFDVDDFIISGELKEVENNKRLSRLEMGITKTSEGKQAIAMFESTYNMYYCYNDAK